MENKFSCWQTGKMKNFLLNNTADSVRESPLSQHCPSCLGSATWEQNACVALQTHNHYYHFSAHPFVRPAQSPRVDMIILYWRYLRFNRCRKKSSWSFLYLTKRRNFWETRIIINFLFGAGERPRINLPKAPLGRVSQCMKKMEGAAWTNTITNVLLASLFS